MRKPLSIAVATIILVAVAWVSPAISADLKLGAKVFQNQCKTCHMNGNNTVKPARTLKQDALEANGKDTIEAIVQQVTDGNGAMPALGSRLKPSQIEAVAAYVLEQAQLDWPR